MNNLEWKAEHKQTETTQYDYTNQAWVVNGRYIACGHARIDCGCWSRKHEGQAVLNGVELN